MIIAVRTPRFFFDFSGAFPDGSASGGSVSANGPGFMIVSAGFVSGSTGFAIVSAGFASGASA
ncbi:MAG: hypothetical protein PUA52_05510 [Lachnospiraceae bacterium]|nr:hypothetical protein [Lachnospiraceae bacterium]